MEENKEYYAFISYKREDKKEAKRLQHALEYYHLPNQLRQENPELPEYVRPVFRDMTDLEVGELSAQIHSALEQSHFLIVVCSPRAAASKWVNDEVEYFISLGKQDKIIPYIIEGVPHASNPDEECYPPALLNLSKEKELLGANINEVGKDSATIRVVSRMFNIRFDTLYQRYQRDQKKRRRQVTTAIILLFLFILGIAGWIRHQNVLLKEREWKMMENQARAVAEKANQLIADGDSYTASLLSLNVLPYDLGNQDKPYVLEAETSLRNSFYGGGTNLMGHILAINSVEFSSDGKYLVSASDDNTIIIWDVNAGRIIKSINGNNGPVDYASFSTDNKKIVSVACDRIFIWDVESGELLDTLSTSVKAAVWGEDDNIIAVNNHCIDVWNIKDRKKISECELGWEEQEWGLSYISDPSIIFSCDKSKICYSEDYYGDYVFDIKTGSGEYYTETYRPNPYVYIDQDNSGKCYIFDSKTNSRIKEINIGDVNDFKIITFDSTGNKMAAIADDNVIRIWDTGLSNVLLGHSNGINTAVFSPDGNYILSASLDSTIRIWDLTTKETLHVMRNGGDYSSVAFYHPNGDSIVSGTRDNYICVWIPKDNGSYSVIQCPTHNGIVWDVHFSPDGKRILSTANDSSVVVIDSSLKNDYYQIKFDVECVLCGAFRPDGKQFVVSIMGWILVYNTETCEKINSFPVHRTSVTGVTQSFSVNNICYSSNGKYILTSSSDKTAAVWNVETGDCVMSLKGHAESVLSANYSPDDKYIVTASADKTIKIWESETGEDIATIKEHTDRVNYAAFSPDGKRIVSASSDNTIRIWDFPPLQELIDETRERFKDRPLTPEEKRKYYLE